MTVVLGKQFLQGVVMVADCRASLQKDGVMVPWRDNTQKIFRLGENLYVGLAGDIEFAGDVIPFLIRQIEKRPKLGLLHVFAKKAPALIKYAYELLVKEKGRQSPLGFIIAGVDFSRPAPILDANGNVEGYMHGDYDKRVFKVESPNFIPVETSFMPSNSTVLIGSGEPAFDRLKKYFDDLYNFNGINSPLVFHASIIGDGLISESKRLGIDSVGGMPLIVTIDNHGSGFFPYRSRSPDNKGSELDLEMYARADGRIVQKNLVTKKEIPLLFPSEVIRIADPTSDLFADLAE
ncbi:MAG: hypothetical protein V4664_00870 [Patescibacteria group bacterium]